MRRFIVFLLICIGFGSAQLSAQNCQADFNFWSQNLTVQFIDSSFSSTGNHTYNWSFGDGTSDTLSGPLHTYNQAGTYFVRLEIVDSICTDTVVKQVTVSNPCVANYSYRVIDSLGTVQFTNLTTPSSGLSYQWDFGDGSPIGTSKDPVHQYANRGRYTVNLMVRGNGTTCSYIDSVTVNYCSVYFVSQSDTNGLATFNNRTLYSNSNAFWRWDFGDGDTSYAMSPTHNYAASGVYNVSLYMFDTISYCWGTYSDSIVILSTPPTGCNASYTIVKDTSSQYSVFLYNTSSNLSSHIYTWDFGDGMFGSGRTPSHQYASFGSYVVCLTILDTIMSCTSTFCDTVGMDSLGNLKAAAGFSISVIDPTLVGIEKNASLEEVTVYPNPAVNNLSVDLRAISSKVEIRIMDISGRIVVERNNTTSGNIEQFDISNLENGLYIISLNDGKSQKTQKFIKTK